jgi:hypothetical protein
MKSIYELRPMLVLGTGVTQLKEDLADLASERLAVIGRHGPAKELLPRLLARGFYEFDMSTPVDGFPVPFVVIDPTGTWKSLKVGTDKLPACPEVAIFGGSDGDAKLLVDATAEGERIGEALGAGRGEKAAKGVILDLSDYGPADKCRFVGSFLGTFCRTRSHGERALVHVIVDGVDLFAPKNPSPNLPKQQQERCAHAVARFMGRARDLGIGATVISPRFDAVDEGVTGRCDAFFIFGQEDGDISLRQWWHIESRDWPSLPPMACHYHHGRTNQLVCLGE